MLPLNSITVLRRVFRATCFAFVQIGLACSAFAATEADFLSGLLPKSGAEPADLPYRYFVPKSYDPAKSYPLILFLHGAGELGQDNSAQLANNANGAMQLISDFNQATYPCFMLAPHTSDPQDWNFDVLDQVIRTIQLLETKYSIDKDRIYVTGLSLGGGATWQMITNYPFFFAAAAPMSGWGPGGWNDPRLVGMPVWNFHAADDDVVPVNSSDVVVADVRQLGGRVIYTRYANGGHNIWSAAYANPFLLPWMMAQKRNHPVTGTPIISAFPPATPNTPTLALSGLANIPGGITKVNWTTNLAPPSWTPFSGTVTSTNGVFTFVDTNTTFLTKFYQLILLP